MFLKVAHDTAVTRPSPSRFLQGSPGGHGKKGKMGRPVKFSLNILFQNPFLVSLASVPGMHFDAELPGIRSVCHGPVVLI